MEWAIALAYSGIQLDIVYHGTEWPVTAVTEDTGNDRTPCAKLVREKGSIHWYLSGEGNIRVDASPSRKEIIMQMLKDSHE